MTDFETNPIGTAARLAAAEVALRGCCRTIGRWGLLIIAATRSEDITTPDGDGDWEVIESRLAEVPALLAERDALADEVADMVPRDWHGLMTILADVYPETAFPTLPDHEARDAGPRIVSLLRRVDALAAKVERVRDWIDHRGVNVDDRDDDYMTGYRDAQRHALQDARGLLAILDGTAA